MAFVIPSGDDPVTPPNRRPFAVESVSDFFP
jgi:hypothetical protein